jgi:parallel beta-helix repeat protein
MHVRSFASAATFSAGAPLMVSLLLAPTPALAAQSYDSCAGRYIESLPAVIATPGTWCLHKDLGTLITAGNAIDIQASNVTLDCNDFKIGGLGAGNGSQAVGVHASEKSNITLRQCNIRGFFTGIFLYRGTGHLVEDNRLDLNLHNGIQLASAANSLVRHNRVFDTGGATNGDKTHPTGIIADGADVIDNVVADVSADGDVGYPAGISVFSNGVGVVIRGNIVRGLVPGTVEGSAKGIYAPVYGRISGNQVVAHPYVKGTGIVGGAYAGPTLATFCADNTVGGLGDAVGNLQPFLQCADAGGNSTF